MEADIGSERLQYWIHRTNSKEPTAHDAVDGEATGGGSRGWGGGLSVGGWEGGLGCSGTRSDGDTQALSRATAVGGGEELWRRRRGGREGANDVSTRVSAESGGAMRESSEPC